MKLKIIDYEDVSRDIATSNPTIHFNTSFHTKDEAPDLEPPSEAPSYFRRWLPLILRTRDMPPTAAQTIGLSRSQAKLLVEAANGSIQTRAINRMYAEDLEDEIAPALSSVSFPPEGLFMRLDAFSPKDGACRVPGRRSLHTVDEAILRLVTSSRARNALYDALESGAERVNLFFVPFNARMQSEREYRAFCPPGGRRITAVSQYRWHQPWMMSELQSLEEIEDVAGKILGGIESLHGQILEDLEEDNDMDRLLLEQGFTFDSFFDEETGRCQLIELNGFGVRSSCGSCLFQWVRDRAVLYGAESDVEFRITR